MAMDGNVQNDSFDFQGGFRIIDDVGLLGRAGNHGTAEEHDSARVDALQLGETAEMIAEDTDGAFAVGIP